MTRREFERVVERAMGGLPKGFRERIKNIAVVVEDWADEETLEEMGMEPPDTLYGLYRGVDLTQRDSSYGNVLPDVITIYQGPIEEDAEGEEDMAEIVQEHREVGLGERNCRHVGAQRYRSHYLRLGRGVACAARLDVQRRALRSRR